MSITAQDPAAGAASVTSRPDRRGVPVARLRGPTPRALVPVAALAAASILSGCAAAPRSGAPPPSLVCHSAQQCVVKVEVTCAQTPCTITVSDETVAANGFAVVWDIVQKPGQSYRFKNPGGVFFKTPAGQGAFTCHAEANDARYRCKGNAADGAAYEYGVDLVGTPPAGKLDPWIVNN